MSQGAPLSPDTLRHLSFAKTLYIHAIEHSNSDSLLDRALAITNFDGSVETFLYVLADYLGADVKERPKYNELLDAVREKLANPSLIQEIGLSNMHIARNDVQHHGIVASLNDVQRYKELTHHTLTCLSKEVLKIELEEISLSELIHNPLVKIMYKKAENAYFSCNYKDALFYTACAFEKAKRIEQNKLWGSRLTIYRINSPLNSDGLINAIVQELEILKLRLDYKLYQKYRGIFGFKLEPFSSVRSDTQDAIMKEIKDQLEDTLDSFENPKESLKKDALYCLSFTLNSILMWEQVERTDWTELITAFMQTFQKSNSQNNKTNSEFH